MLNVENKLNFTMYSVFSKMLLQEGLEKTIEYAVRMGYSSVELLVKASDLEKNPIPDIATARTVRKALEENGLTVACYSVYANVWDEKTHVPAMLSLLDIAAELGAPFFHHTMLPWLVLGEASPKYEEAVEVAVEAAAFIADYAATKGITCIYEDQGQYINGVNGFRGFWTQIKKRCKNVGICGDLGNIMFVNEKPEDFLEAYKEDICHVHVKDYIKKCALECPGRYWNQAKGDTWLRETMVGSGEVDFYTCMKILREHGYQGAFALELTHPEPIVEGTYQAMEYLERMWRMEKRASEGELE